MTTRIDHVDYGEVQVFSSDCVIGADIANGTSRWEYHVCEFLKRYYRPGTNLVDVGAFIGLHTRYAARHIVSQGCTVYSVEAQPEVFSVLKANTESLPNVVRFNAVASDITGTQLMSIPKDYTTWKNPGGLGVVDAEFSHPDLVAQEIPSIRLENLPFENVSIMKIDVEGHEMQVIEGATKLILKSRPVIVMELMGGKDRVQHAVEIQERIDTVCRTFEYTLILRGADDYVFVPSEIANVVPRPPAYWDFPYTWYLEPLTTPSECPLDDSLLSQQARF